MQRTALAVLLAVGLVLVPITASARPVFDPAEFTSPRVINYSWSPVGPIPAGAAVTDQYLAYGLLHDGNTTTPPGPPGMSSLSGLPGLEVGSDGQNDFDLSITFISPVVEVGAYYLMGGPENPITLSAFDAAEQLIESVTILPDDMPLNPGQFGFNEGFVGLIVDEPISSVVFAAVDLALVIDDLHFVPEPVTATLLALGAIALLRRRR